MKEELVSIIIPIYNAEKYLEETLNSVINQEYKNWEAILVNDCSTDNSEVIIKRFLNKDNRFKYFKLNKNSGVARARNFGIEKAKGRFIAFLDSDDIWDIKKLKKQIKFMSNNRVGLTFTSYEIIDENGKKTNKVVSVPKEIDYKRLLKGNVIGCFTVIIDRKIISNIKMPYNRHEDYATWLYILKDGFKALGINETLGFYRKNSGSLSGNKIKSALWTWTLYRKILKMSPIKSLYYFLHYIIRGFLKHI